MASARPRSQTEPVQLQLFPPNRYLTIDEVAKIMSVPKSFIYRRTCRGHSDPIPSFRFGGHLRFRLDEIEEWIATHRVEHEELPRITSSVRRSAAAAKTARGSRGPAATTGNQRQVEVGLEIRHRRDLESMKPRRATEVDDGMDPQAKR